VGYAATHHRRTNDALGGSLRVHQPAVIDCVHGAGDGPPKLRLLSVDGIKITDADLPPPAASELTDLSVGDTAITDPGAATLATSKSLKSISLHDTKITDAGIVALAKPKLERLMLFRLPLTDASLVALAKAPELSVLWLGDNNFTESGLAKFAAARPKVKVPK
jgi:hypothetical protein